jgi:pilus assembly protein CpaF
MKTVKEKTKEIRNIVKNKPDFININSDEEILTLISKTVFKKSVEEYISPAEKKEIIENVFNSIRRLDIIESLLSDESVTEIMVNGHESIFIEKEGRILKTDLSFESSKKLENIIQTIVSKVNRVVNESNPIVDARLQDGSRVNVVLPPVALNGPILTIRKFSKIPFSLEKLISIGTITRELGDVLSSLVKAGYNIFISGGTGSGKTTLLNVLSNFIPKDERIITIEDSAELRINGVDNLISLETRSSVFNTKNNITIKDLIKTSLRMRPDRIIVGEVRGGEALDMLQAMNTGHDGSISTGHGNSAKDILNRIETMVLTGVQMPLQAIRMQIASAIDIIIHIERMRDRSRKVTSLSEVTGIKNGEITLNNLYEYSSNSLNEGKLIRTKNNLLNRTKMERAGIETTL